MGLFCGAGVVVFLLEMGVWEGAPGSGLSPPGEGLGWWGGWAVHDACLSVVGHTESLPSLGAEALC